LVKLPTHFQILGRSQIGSSGIPDAWMTTKITKDKLWHKPCRQSFRSCDISTSGLAAGSKYSDKLFTLETYEKEVGSKSETQTDRGAQGLVTKLHHIHRRFVVNRNPVEMQRELVSKYAPGRAKVRDDHGFLQRNGQSLDPGDRRECFELHRALNRPLMRNHAKQSNDKPLEYM